MPKTKFKNLPRKKQKRICDRKVYYWAKMRKALRATDKAITNEEKTAIIAQADMDLNDDPATEEDDE